MRGALALIDFVRRAPGESDPWPDPHRTIRVVIRRRDTDDEVSDETLLSGIALGDNEATLLFVRRYQRRLFGLALGIVGDPGIAEDVAQEAFLRIFRHAAVYDVRRAAVSTWVLTITRNLAIDALRVRRATPVAPGDLVFVNLVSRDTPPEDVAANADEAARAWTALTSLPLDQRRCVVLAAVYGRTAAEIATSESIPLGTAKSRLRLGMIRLRDAVFEEMP
ncbi:MAG: sigma-70 family RNA polymerase sigma factor [Acidimicrobiaceae bacterium]|nr:sigma-70 family RNA polymerase sigma factor [Acidimicrobiaceae bacterium]